MQKEDRINAFEELGFCLNKDSSKLKLLPNSNLDKLNELINNTKHHNGWFTEKNIIHALESISIILKKAHLINWLSSYKYNNTKPKRIGVVTAGNIPLVGFHDFLCVLITGNTFVGKLSSKDELLLPFLSEILIEIEPNFKEKIEFTAGKLNNIDAIIGTGSNNTSRYLEYYYGKYPNIIRKSRNSVAVLYGNETKKEIELLGKDIFTYYGLGCRNISKLLIPENYDLDIFFNGIFGYKEVLEHKKYGNNYDYYKTIYAMSKIKIIENGFLLLKEDSSVTSPVSVLHYEFYSSKVDLEKKISNQFNQIQCVVSQKALRKYNTVEMGSTQYPMLEDYSDNINTLSFINSLR